jgi:hypothetical protein
MIFFIVNYDTTPFFKYYVSISLDTVSLYFSFNFEIGRLSSV